MRHSAFIQAWGRYFIILPGNHTSGRSGKYYLQGSQAFFSATGIKAGIKIILEKKIPIAAGLGGGSSDAAAVVMGLNALLNSNLGREELLDIASPLVA